MFFTSIYIIVTFILILSLGNKESRFYKIITPVNSRPKSIKGLTANRRFLLSLSILIMLLAYWMMARSPLPDFGWGELIISSVFFLLVMTFLCFRKLHPGQFLIVFSAMHFMLAAILLTAIYILKIPAGDFGPTSYSGIKFYLILSLPTIIAHGLNYVLNIFFKHERLALVISFIFLLILERWLMRFA